MKDENKTKRQLIDELAESRQRLSELEALEDERLRAPQDLLDSAQLLETMLDHTHMLVAYMDPQFNFVKVNRAYAEADERDPSFFPGKNHFDLYPNAENESIFGGVVQTGEPYFASARPFEYAEHPERGVSYWYWSLMPIKSSEGQVTGLVLTLVDVTERVRAEEALRESTEKIRATFESMTDGITFGDLQGNIVDSNEATVRMHEFESKEELIGQSAFELIAESDQARALENLQKTLATGGSGVIEYKLVTKTGREFDGELNAVLLRDEQGNPSAFVALTRDISERKRAEEAHRESEEKYSMLFNEMLTGLSLHEIILDDNGKPVDYRFLDVNPAFEKHTGLKKQDLVGRTVLEVLPGTEPIWIETSGEVALGGEPVHFEHYSSEIGKYYEVLTFCPRKGQFATLSSDITERKRMEEELEKHRDHLEELVAERTRELGEAHAELVRQERLSALGQLTATVAHEIRNPLGTIGTAVFAIGDAIERNQTGRVERSLQLAERNIVRCDRIITELLDYARERVLQLQPTHVDTWLNGVLDEQTIPESIVCIRELTCGVEIPVDREHLRRAVINVVENAVDELQDEGAVGNQLTVSTGVVGDRLEIRVSDTGLGIPADVMDKAFEPLFSTKTIGVGLGLPIVKNIMQQHDGGIEIQSQVGKGTTVTLWLPASSKGGG